MSSQQNKQIVRRFNDAFDQGDLATCRKMLAPDCLAYQPGVPQPLNIEAFWQVGQMFLDSFSHAEHLYEEQIAEGENVVTRAIWKAVHDRSPFQGIPAAGRKLNLEIVLFDRIVDGVIVEHRAIFDVMTLMQQLGALHMPEQT
jgi:steroid delta-isomerase-like uncharacterized protein